MVGLNKILKYHQLINENLDEEIKYLREIFLNLNDEGYEVNFDVTDGVSITIKNWKNRINFNQLISDLLIHAVEIMTDNGWEYTASYNWSYTNTNNRFYIYNDERRLRVNGHKMTKNWPTVDKITITFKK